MLHSSEAVRRRFWRFCSFSMFFDPTHLGWLGSEIMMGALGGPTNTRILLHISVADKGDSCDFRPRSADQQ